MKRVKKIYREAIATFGVGSQINMAIEECGELIVALQHFRRGRATKADVITEIADVQIMCEQMQELFGDTETSAERHRKLERLMQRIEDHIKRTM